VSEPRDFDQTVGQFRIFLEKNGYSREIAWIEPDDLLLSGKRLVYIKAPLPARNEEKARHSFESGMSTQIGVWFREICEAGGITFCHAWAPQTRSEAQNVLMGTGLKMSVKIDVGRMPGEAVSSRLRWLYLRFKYRAKQALKIDLFH
jgi:hypothetical protein